MIHPIEENPELAQQYGIASVWINLVEYALKWALLTKKKFTTNVPNIVMDLFDNQTLGQIILVSEGILEERTIGKLRDLNNKRRILAHGVVSQKYLSTGKKLMATDTFLIS